MQTFLSHPDYSISSNVLDKKRLGKQRVEGYQILKANIQGPEIAYRVIEGKRVLLWFNPLDSGDGICKTPWYNHPATKMWRGHEISLWHYIVACCVEWTTRGYEDSILQKSQELILYHIRNMDSLNDSPPKWLGNHKLHSSHRSNLLRKNYNHYSKFGWKESPNQRYFWPV